MSNKTTICIVAGVTAGSLILAAGFWISWWLVAALFAIGGGLAWRFRDRIPQWKRGQPTESTSETQRREALQSGLSAATRSPDAQDSDQLVQDMFVQGRWALLIRPQIIDNLAPAQVLEASKRLAESMALVPAGPVCVRMSGDVWDQDEDEDDFNPAANLGVAGSMVMVDPVFLERVPVTNAAFAEFVRAGGYEQMALWDEEALPALLDFVDQSGQPGPRFWQNGTFPTSQAHHPVVGVSWYEAAAYSRWCGKRLPSDAEWVKAGSWPVEASPGQLLHRRFPWGNSFDARRANIWGNENNGTVSVHELPQGASVAGVQQLIGNVWEWTSSNFGSPNDPTLRLSVAMKSVRGGAFDTYFETQADCHFQSGENPFKRKHNIGFRVALGTCDIDPRAVTGVSGEPNELTNVAPGEAG